MRAHLSESQRRQAPQILRKDLEEIRLGQIPQIANQDLEAWSSHSLVSPSVAWCRARAHQSNAKQSVATA